MVLLKISEFSLNLTDSSLECSSLHSHLLYTLNVDPNRDTDCKRAGIETKIGRDCLACETRGPAAAATAAAASQFPKSIWLPFASTRRFSV